MRLTQSKPSFLCRLLLRGRGEESESESECLSDSIDCLGLQMVDSELTSVTAVISHMDRSQRQVLERVIGQNTHTHQLHFTPLLFSDTVVEWERNSFFIFNWSEFSGVWVDFEAVHDASLHFCNSLMNRHKCPFSSNEPAFITSSSLGGFYFNHVTHYRGWIWLPGMKPTWTKLNCHFNTSRSDDCFSFMKEKNTFSSSSEVIGGAVCHHLKERLWTPTWRPRAHVSVVGK